MSSVFDAQQKVLKKMVRFAENTDYGNKYGFSEIKSYQEYREQVPVSDFSDYANYKEQELRGVPDLCWPGASKKFAISAGTTGKPKQIALTPERERSDVTFLRRVALSYLKKNPNIFKLFGKQVSLPGMIEQHPEHPGILIGEISGFLATFAPPILGKIQLIPANEAVKMNFSDKVERMIELSLKKDIRVFTSLPSVGLRFFQMLLERSGKNSISEIWPNFRLFIAGGEPLSSYREHILKLCSGTDLHFIENYGASEGYFAFNTDQDRNDLKLVVNNNVFYEWIPDPSENRDELKNQKTIPTWEVEAGRPYGMVITSNSGLWRYLLNDVVIFTDLTKPRIRVAGRASDVLDSYGECIEAIHVEETLKSVVEETGGVYSNYSLGVVLNSEKENPTHIWFIEWAEPPADPKAFAKKIDEKLIDINRSYEIRRNGGAISMPQFFTLNKEALATWREKTLKEVRAQTKIPRMIHDQDKCRALMELCERMA